MSIIEFPSTILQCLKSGEFTVNINGHNWHAEALEEAHEMDKNKDIKCAVLCPTSAYLQKTT